MPAAGITRRTLVTGRTVLEPGAPVVWFTFPGLRHDIGRFHTVDGAFTGCYANVLTPVERDGDMWTTTDLFLDVFVDLAGGVHVLDEDELEEAVDRGWISADAARGAEREASRLVAAARDGTWPPPIVDAWPLDRARDAARGATA